MSSQIGDRIEVGTCDLGNVFIFHTASVGDYVATAVNERWQVRAGNHTIGTYDTESGAEAVARALVGDITVPPAEPKSEPEPEYVTSARARIAKK